MKISCNIIRDILPLYIDKAVCADTEELVEEHLKDCQECRNEAERLSTELEIPVAEGQDRPLKKLKRSISRKRIAAMLFTAAAVLLAVCCWLLPRTVGTVAHTSNIKITEDILALENGEKEFSLEISSTVGKALRWETEYIYSESGEITGEIITLYQVKKDRFLGEDPKISLGFTFDEAVTDDFTVVLHFTDRDFTYSMREKGIIE